MEEYVSGALSIPFLWGPDWNVCRIGVRNQNAGAATYRVAQLMRTIEWLIGSCLPFGLNLPFNSDEICSELKEVFGIVGIRTMIFGISTYSESELLPNIFKFELNEV